MNIANKDVELLPIRESTHSIEAVLEQAPREVTDALAAEIARQVAIQEDRSRD